MTIWATGKSPFLTILFLFKGESTIKKFNFNIIFQNCLLTFGKKNNRF